MLRAGRRLEVVSEGVLVLGHDELRALVTAAVDRPRLRGAAGRWTHANSNTLIELTDDGATAETFAVVYLANGSGQAPRPGVGGVRARRPVALTRASAGCGRGVGADEGVDALDELTDREVEGGVVVERSGAAGDLDS